VSTVSQQLSASNLVKLIEALQKIIVSVPKVKTNEGSIDDNNGGRIIM
jgi:hypothetical protein